jgi:hypothetical protein
MALPLFKLEYKVFAKTSPLILVLAEVFNSQEWLIIRLDVRVLRHTV